ncbi:hypothetical protein B0T18DRAFT_397767 [Schizothecium vesticola]|uniref:Uncharacterized protein n=1 Tax=Schizothecium vesticola TaxID=314040 RepID=A0AA40F9Z0_9PEZI|nr:hypothetical protein B0T18DRAFT_397767 [Schizothecium vesticola]
MVERISWFEGGSQLYSAKEAAMFRLNQYNVQNAIAAGEAGEGGEFQRFLFLLGLSSAHEIVHIFVGYLTGNEDVTPGRVQYPRPRFATRGLGSPARHGRARC